MSRSDGSERTNGSCQDGSQPGSDIDERPTVSVARTSPTRSVFTEEGNADGWIATDLAVVLER